MKTKITLIIAMWTVSGGLYAGEVGVELGLLSKKIGLCESSIVAKNCSNTKFCKDMDNYFDYLFKDSATAYFEYHTKAGNMTKKNTDMFISIAERYGNISELRKGESAVGSQCKN